MFSKNNKISKRQMFRLLTYDFLGVGTLLLPSVLCKTSGTATLFPVLAATVAGLLLALLYGWVIASMQEGESYPDYLRRCFGKWIGGLILAGYVLYNLGLGGYTTYLFGHLIVSNLLKEESFYAITAGILLLAVYSIRSGIEGRARVYEILFWILVLPLVGMLLLAVRDVEPARLFPLIPEQAGGVLQGSVLAASLFSIGSLSLFLVPYAKEKRIIGQACSMAVLFVGLFLLLTQCILQGIFGVKMLAEMRYPVIVLMSMVKIPGGFLQRQDALMVAVWFFTVFALLNSNLFYAADNLGCLFGTHKSKWTKWVIGITALILFATASFCYRSEIFMQLLLRVFLQAAVPFSIIVPFLARLCLDGRKHQKQVAALFGITLSVLLLGGCSTMELENRSFPLAMGIDTKEGDCLVSYKFQDLSAIADEKANTAENTDFVIRDTDFFTCISKYANNTNRILDYNHMKALILSEDFAEDQKRLSLFLKVCGKEELITRNTLLFFAEDASEILAMDENLDTTIGSYLEELIESRSDYRLKDAVTLGDLANDRVNQEQLLLVPVLTEDGGLPVIRNYYAVSQGRMCGEISVEEAVLSFLVQGRLKQLSFTLQDGTPVTLRRIRAMHTFSRGEVLCYHTKLSVEAEVAMPVENRKRKLLQKKISTEIATHLAQCAGNLSEAPGIDLTNSYSSLGMHKGGQYARYEEKPDAYRKDLTLDFRVDTTLLN